MNEKMPVTVRRSIELLGLLALGMMIVLGQNVIMPLVMAFFFSLLLLPVFRWLNKRGIPEVFAIILSIVALALFIAGIMFFLSYQVAILLKDVKAIRENLMMHWTNISNWINEKLHFTAETQVEAIKSQVADLSENAGTYLTGAAGSLSGVLIFVGLLPIYIFLMLFYRNLLLRFTYMWFDEGVHPKVESAVRETEVIVKYYLVGLLIQIAYLTILLGGILMLFGIKHAILIGVIFAILNLIPYIGALVGNLIGVILTLTSSTELWQIWVVLGTIAFVQFLDNNILMPRIVGSKVKVNALASIVGIVLGGALAGVSGMFLSIPVMAVLKIVFDKTDHLRQWGVLIGDARPNLSPLSNRMFRIKRRLEKDRDEEVRDAQDEAKEKDQ